MALMIGIKTREIASFVFANSPDGRVRDGL